MITLNRADRVEPSILSRTNRFRRKIPHNRLAPVPSAHDYIIPNAANMLREFAKIDIDFTGKAKDILRQRKALYND